MHYIFYNEAENKI